MTRKQFEKLEEVLRERGYKKYNNAILHEDYYWSKGFKRQNGWGHGRPGLLVNVRVYDNMLHPEFGLAPYDKQVGVEVTAMVSRTVKEQVDMMIMWKDDTTIEGVERMAEGFYDFVCGIKPKPGEEVKG